MHRVDKLTKSIPEQRISELCEQEGFTPTKLSTEAGLSTDTISNWLRKMEEARLAGEVVIPGKLEHWLQLARRYRKPVDWFLSEHQQPQMSAVSGTTLEDAHAVAAMLAELDGVSTEAAWRLIGEVPPLQPTSLRLYREARRRMNMQVDSSSAPRASAARVIEKSVRGQAEKLSERSNAVRPRNTRKGRN